MFYGVVSGNFGTGYSYFFIKKSHKTRKGFLIEKLFGVKILELFWDMSVEHFQTLSVRTF